MHRNDLPRVYELRDLLTDPVPADAYFANFDASLTELPIKKARFIEIEGELQGLDAEAWAYLKAELSPLLRAKHPMRGWSQLFDKLNQATAYNYLKRVGCAGIRFIPEATANGRMTPDIAAMKDGRAVLCEVKTINTSEIEALRRVSGGVGQSTDQLDDKFLGKLQSTIEKAAEQMQAYDPNVRARRIAFVMINFDDSLHEYVGLYAPQLEAFGEGYAASGPEIVLCYKGPFGAGVQVHGG